MGADERTDAEMAEEHDDTTTTTTQAPPARKPAASVKATERPLPEDPDEARDELRRTREALAKANKEAKDHRLAREELQRAEDERSQATLSETEKTKKAARDAEAARVEAERRAADAEAALAEERVDAVVEREATKQGFAYPDITPRLIDRKRPLIDEETGRPDAKAIKEALERLAKDRPGLIEAAPRGGTPPREGPRRQNNQGGANRPAIEDELRSTGNYA